MAMMRDPTNTALLFLERSIGNVFSLILGFHSGVVKLLGEAVRDEQDKRTVYKSKTVRRYNKKISEITLIGITTDSLVNELEAFRTGDTGSGVSISPYRRSTFPWILFGGNVSFGSFGSFVIGFQRYKAGPRITPDFKV